LAAADCTHLAPEAISPWRDERGRPLAVACYVTVAHTRGAYGAAAAPVRIGLDVEARRSIPDAVWARVGGGEAALLSDRAAEWTAREAVVKALGVGLAGGASEIRFRLDQPSAAGRTLDAQAQWSAHLHGVQLEGWTEWWRDFWWSLALERPASGTQPPVGE
jgi:hypothetical protein